MSKRFLTYETEEAKKKTIPVGPNGLLSGRELKTVHDFKPFEVDRVDYDSKGAYIVVDLRKLLVNVSGIFSDVYSISTVDYVNAANKSPNNKAYLRLIVKCDDGTEKVVTSNKAIISGEPWTVSITNNSRVSAISIYSSLYTTNSKLVVNTLDCSTSETVTVTEKKNINYLGINNYTEFTPTGDYQPATKKYVDDAIAAALASLNTTT